MSEILVFFKPACNVAENVKWKKKQCRYGKHLNLDLITVNVCYFNEVSLPLINRAKLKEEEKKSYSNLALIICVLIWRGGNGAFTVTASGSHNSAKVTSLHRLGVPLYLTESKTHILFMIIGCCWLALMIARLGCDALSVGGVL